MTYTTTRLGPEFTPDIVKKVIYFTVGISLLSAISNDLFHWLLSMPGPQEWLSLSWWGLSRLFLWQPITFLFIEPTGLYGVTISLLISLTFQMYLLWVMGSYVAERLGKVSFLQIYFGSGLIAGAVALGLGKFLGYNPVLAGTAPSLIGLSVIWMMLNSESEIWLFFIIPIKAKWLISGIIGAILLVSLSQLALVDFFFYLTGALFGYLYAVIRADLSSPFPFTHRFERWSRKWKKSKKAKIYDFKTGQEESDDDRFVDQMLQKIAQKGEKSLSWRERRRMQKISEQKAKQTKKR